MAAASKLLIAAVGAGFEALVDAGACAKAVLAARIRIDAKRIPFIEVPPGTGATSQLHQRQ
jgi:hypothetical protein